MTDYKTIRERIQEWVDERFGVPNQFNTELLLDFFGFILLLPEMKIKAPSESLLSDTELCQLIDCQRPNLKCKLVDTHKCRRLNQIRMIAKAQLDRCMYDSR